MEKATFAGGCFWCTEAIFKRIKGVISVIPGYSGGENPNPTYEQVASGATGHAESVQVTFDPQIVSYQQLVAIFFGTHDPTTLNRQDYDEGTQYRSVIFYHNDEQKKSALAVQEKLEQEHTFINPILTEIVPFEAFYEAEPEHKEYYENNKNAPYCQFITRPKIDKLLKEFADKIKAEYK